jgi:hypothetical protein
VCVLGPATTSIPENVVDAPVEKIDSPVEKKEIIFAQENI